MAKPLFSLVVQNRQHVAPEPLMSPLPVPCSGDTRWTPLKLGRSSARHKRKAPHPHVQIRLQLPCPRPPVTHSAPAAALPAAILAPATFRCAPGGTLAASETAERLFPRAGPRFPDSGVLASWRHPNKSHASRALIKPLPPPRRRPAAGRAQAGRPLAQPWAHGQRGSARYLRHGLSRWGMPLQSLVLLPPLQRPMLPQARLPLMRHGGRGSAGAEQGRSADRALSVHLQAGEEMAAAPRPRVLYRFLPL